MKIGFSILSHKEPNNVFIALLKELNQYPNKSISIHHDFNQTPILRNFFDDFNVNLTENSYRTYWSHTNNIYAIWDTFKQLYNDNCDWYITLSANCIPIKNQLNILQFLKSAKEDGFIECNDVYSDYFEFYKYFRKGINSEYLFKIPFISRKGKLYYRSIRKKRNPKKIPFNSHFKPFHGSDWFMINQRSMQYLLNQESKVFELNNFLKDVNKGADINICPPEFIFQTILKNNSNLNLNNNNFRYINWKDAEKWHPNTLTVEHWTDIQKSDALFARKFDYPASKELIELIQKEILSV